MRKALQQIEKIDHPPCREGKVVPKFTKFGSRYQLAWPLTE